MSQAIPHLTTVSGCAPCRPRVGRAKSAEWVPVFLRHFAEHGSILQACRVAGVSHSHVMKRRRADPEFDTAVRRIKADRWRPVRGVEERDALVLRYLHLVEQVAWQLYRLRYVRRHWQDCLSVGWLGLIRVAETWRAGGRFTFAVCARNRIRWDILHEARRHRVSRERLYGDYNTPDGFDDLANIDLPARVPAGPAPTEVAEAVARALPILDARDRLILTLRFGLDGRGIRLASEVAAMLGVDEKTVRRRRDRALAELAAHPDICELAPRPGRG